MAFTVSTPAFKDGATVPKQFTCDGDDTAPPLEVSDPPEGTRSFALDTNDAQSLTNSFGKKGYGGPCPPPGHGAHRYFLTVYAVDVPSLGLKGDSRQGLEKALGAHTLGTAKLMG